MNSALAGMDCVNDAQADVKASKYLPYLPTVQTNLQLQRRWYYLNSRAQSIDRVELKTTCHHILADSCRSLSLAMSEISTFSHERIRVANRHKAGVQFIHDYLRYFDTVSGLWFRHVPHSDYTLATGCVWHWRSLQLLPFYWTKPEQLDPWAYPSNLRTSTFCTRSKGSLLAGAATGQDAEVAPGVGGPMVEMVAGYEGTFRRIAFPLPERSSIPRW